MERVELPLRHGQVTERLLRETGTGAGRDGVAGDAVAGHLHGNDLGERGDAGLRRAVVRLPDVAEDAGRGGGVHDTAGGGLARLGQVPPVGAGGAGDQEVAAQVDLDHGVPLLDRHVEDHPVAQDAGVVHDRVDPAEGVVREVEEGLGPLGFGDVVEVRDGLAAGGDDLLDHLGGGPGVGAAAVPFASEIVHDDRRALGREEDRLPPADPPSGTRDHGHLAVEQGHACPPVILERP